MTIPHGDLTASRAVRRPAPSRRTLATLAAVALTTVAVGSASCAPAPVGNLELTLTLGDYVEPDIVGITVQPDWAGAGRGPRRDEGWRRIPVDGSAVWIPADGKTSVTVAAGPLPVGDYDRVFAAADWVRATRRDGTSVELVNHIEPIARSLSIRSDGSAVVDIELAVLHGAFGSPTSEAFVRDAQLREHLATPTTSPTARDQDQPQP